ncbi:ABC transporter G family member [Zostera marina]|uniref:ABC transporter G family member n=1 Tax=Zostera marina TaxID=29655 RepID=A0A0K9Q2T2_ZOSMR|nr:ABC transporter G family member [Zostera marina]
MSKGEREQRVDALIEELGLVHVAQSYVGDEEIRGVSGGERRRVSIGVDVIHDPPILLLDEPTSGLDSSTALHVVALLATMAQRRNQIVILTIHQPSYRILEYISYFLLLTSSGNVAHSGSLRCLEKTIKKMDLKVPIQLNALEFAMEIPLMAATRPTLEDHLKSPMIFAPPTPASPLSEELILKKQSRYSEITHLSWRFWRVMYRTKQLFLSRIMQALVGGFGLGSVYLHIKQSKTGVTERLGLFAFTLSFLLSSTVEALPIFLQERRVLMRESSRSMYRLSSYMIANTLIFMPFLLIISIIFSSSVYWLVGLRQSYTAFAYFTFVVWLILLMASSLVQFLSAISPDFILGNSLISTSLGVFFLFSGYFIPKSSIPRYWMFMYYVSPYRYPLDSLLVNEYWGMKDVCFQWVDYGAGPSKCGLTGSDVLTNRGLDRDCRWENVWIMLGFFMFYRFLSWIVLIWKASRTMH